MSKEKVGFLTMAEIEKAAAKIPEVGVGMLGYAFMGKAHSHAWRDVPFFFWPPPAIPRLIALCGRSGEKVAESARRFGFESAYTDWRQLVKDGRVQIFDNSGPNDVHAEPCIAAAEAGKHVVCEKPLARSGKEAKRMYDAVARTKVKHMCAYNYRFVPAVRLAKKLIEDGFVGRIYHFRARYCQEWIMDPASPLVWRLRKEVAGSGPLGDLGSHIIDLARFLVGDVKAVTAMAKTFISERPLPEAPAKRGAVTVEDAFVATAEFQNGAIGTLEATRFAGGRKNFNNFEVNGEKASIEFNLERLNELRVYWKDEPVKEIAGWHDILVTEGYHPLIGNVYWPQGHIIGWEHTFINEFHHFLECVMNDTPVAPYAANFEDGYKVDAVCDAILQAAAKGKKVNVKY